MEDNSTVTLYDQYKREFDELYNKHLEKYVWTQHSIHILGTTGRFPPIKDEDIYMSIPRQPLDNREAWQLFKDYFGELQFIASKMQYAVTFKEWTLNNVEAEIQEHERFIKKAMSVNVPTNDLTDSYYGENGVEIEYIKLKNNYYNLHAINKDVWEIGITSMMALLYGKYILYYNFLQKQRELLSQIRQENAFSKKHPLKQLDMVLDWFCKDKDAFPHADFPTIHKSLSEKFNYDCYANILYEILKKLEDDGKITTWETEVTRYIGASNTEVKDLVRKFQIKWEGRYFISKEIGGYQGQQTKSIEEHTRLYNIEKHQTNHRKWMTWLTLILSVFGVLSLFLQSFDKFHVVFRIYFWTAFFLLVCGIFIGICTFLIILGLVKKEKM